MKHMRGYTTNVAHPGAPIYRKAGTMSDWSAGGWQCIGTLGTEARGAQDPKDDVPDKWAFYLADEVLLRAEFDTNYPKWLRVSRAQWQHQTGAVVAAAAVAAARAATTEQPAVNSS